MDRVIVLEKRRFGGHWFSLWRQTRKTRWGAVVDLRGSGLSRFLRTRRRAVLKRGPSPEHKVIEAARLIRLEDAPPSPFLFMSPETDARAKALTAGAGPILAMAPGANWLGKTWPVERFSQVAQRLLGPGGPLAGGRLMILGGEDDGERARALRDVVPRKRLIDLTGKADLLTAYAALKHARLFIGNDSGAMHLAAAAGVPTLGLFGPSDEALYGPWGPLGRAVRGPRDFAQIRAVDPGFSQALCHMMDLPAAKVIAGAQALLAETEA